MVKRRKTWEAPIKEIREGTLKRTALLGKDLREKFGHVIIRFWSGSRMIGVTPHDTSLSSVNLPPAILWHIVHYSLFSSSSAIRFLSHCCTSSLSPLVHVRVCQTFSQLFLRDPPPASLTRSQKHILPTVYSHVPHPTSPVPHLLRIFTFIMPHTSSSSKRPAKPHRSKKDVAFGNVEVIPDNASSKSASSSSVARASGSKLKRSPTPVLTSLTELTNAHLSQLSRVWQEKTLPNFEADKRSIAATRKEMDPFDF